MGGGGPAPDGNFEGHGMVSHECLAPIAGDKWHLWPDEGQHGIFPVHRGPGSHS